jgi:GWxTD domain-containing protein
MFPRCVKYIIPLVLIIGNTGNIAQTPDLPEQYKKWLDEEVVYIITPREREVFLELTTDRERNLFIEAFWKQRDPTPNTPANEFREEHYRRISYANQFFGRTTARPGWRTDRGRMYIILGEPRDKMSTSGKNELHPTETWFYQGMTELGLPPGFHLIFYQRGNTGEFRLYSPLQDGPQMLLRTYRGDPRDYIAANEALREVDSQLAEFTLSLVTGDQTTNLGRPSMTSDILIDRVVTTPVRQIEDLYAQKFLDYKDIIDVEYSANYIGSDALVKVSKSAAGTYFISYALQPERLSIGQYEDKYYATLKLNGTISNEEGRTIYQYEKSAQLEFDAAQMRDFSHRSLNLQDMIPVIPGNIRLSVLLQNEVSKEFTSLERTLYIPGEEQELQMTSLIIGYETKSHGPADNRLRPFQNGDTQMLFQASRVFKQQGDLWISFQIHGMDQTLKEKGRIRYSLERDQEEILAFERDVKANAKRPNFLEQISLQDLPPSHYRIKVSLLLDGQEVLADQEEFDITHVQALPRPWFYTKNLPGIKDPIYDYTLGTQFFNDGQYRKARMRLDEAYQKNPQSMEIALQLSRSLVALEEYDPVESILLPFIDRPQPAEFDAYLVLSEAYRVLGRLNEAIEVLNKSLRQNGLHPLTLNALGRNYMEMEDFAEALKALEKSLEIEPEQAEIKAQVDELKKKITELSYNKIDIES